MTTSSSPAVVKRFFGKKRGSRNMRSDKLGGASLLLFFIAFFCAGGGSLWWILQAWTVPDWRANYDFVQAECLVVDRRLAEQNDDGVVSYRPEVRIAYEVAGQPQTVWTFDIAGQFTTDRRAAENRMQGFEVGRSYPCWYDPLEIDRAIIERGHNWSAWLALVLPFSFLAIGATGLVFSLLSWDKSTERRAVLARRAAELDPFDVAEDFDDEFPTVPRMGHLTNSPGTQLRYRLPLETSGWGLLPLVIVTVTWNVVLAIWGAWAASTWLLDSPRWVELVAWLPFAAVGALLVVLLIRRIRQSAGLGGTIMEIDQHPLCPGGRYQLVVQQSGHVTIERLRVVLACDEEVRYVQGTNLRTARQRVVEVELLAEDSVGLVRGTPWEARQSFDFPASAMHSFHATHNRVVWRLVLEAALADGRSWQRSCLINVFPPAAQIVVHKPLRAMQEPVA